MSYFEPQNPGIGGIDELTPTEELFLTTLAGLTGTEGEVLTWISGNPSWETASGGGHTIQDEGVSLTQRTKLNFVGAGVTVTDGGAGTDDSIVTINTGSGDFLANGTVPMTGDLNMDSNDISNPSTIQFDTTPTLGAFSEGRLYYDSTEKTLSLDSGTGETLQIGQEMWLRVVNKTGVQINDGQVVYISGSQGNRPTATLAKADAIATLLIIGIATQDIADNAEGMITVYGEVHGQDTTGYTEGDVVYLSSSTAGAYTNTVPTTGISIQVGIITNVHATQGKILVDTGTPLDTDGTLEFNSNSIAPTQKAIKTYADTKAPIASPTFTTNITTPLVLGGTSTTQDLTLQTTSGVGATGADMHFLVGNNGATEAMTILNSGNVGIGTTAPTVTLDVKSDTGVVFRRSAITTENIAFLSDSGGNKITFNDAGTRATVLSNSDSITDIVGRSMTVRSGNAITGTTLSDLNGGQLLLSSGAGTGTGSSNILFQTGTTLTTGMTAQTLSTKMAILGNGNVGIGTTAPDMPLHISGTFATPIHIQRTSASNASIWYQNNGSSMYAGIGDNNHFYIGTSNNLSTGAITTFQRTGNVGIGTASPAVNLEVYSAGSTKFLVTSLTADWFGFKVAAGASPTFYWNSGDDIRFVTTTSSDGVTGISDKAKITSAGLFGIGVTTPTAVLHLKAGTATASTAPLKFTSGTLLTTPEAGAVEFLTDAYYGTITTGGKRRMFVTSSDGRATAQTAANASVSTHTLGASDASFEVSANVLVTTSSAENFTVTVDYTDEGNTARTLTLNFQTIAGVIGTAINFANGAVPYEGIPVHIRCKASTTITVKTASGGTYTGATYNVEGNIKKIN